MSWAPRNGVVHTIGPAGPARTFVAPTVRFLQDAGVEAELWVGTLRSTPEHVAAVRADLTIETEVVGGPLAILFRVARLTARLARRRPQVIHAHLTRCATWPLLAALVTRVPIRIYHNHGMATFGHAGVMRWMGLRIERLNAWLATDVLFCSPSTLAQAREHGIVGADRGRLLGAGSDAGIDRGEFAESAFDASARTAARAAFGVDEDAFVLGYIARPIPTKGLDVALRAWRRLRRRPCDRLLVAGCSVAECEQFDDGGSLPDGVVVIGYQPDLRPFFAAVDVVALCSRSEGFPNSLLEAAAAGRACVGTDVTGICDAIENGVTGILIPPGDVDALAAAVLRLASDASERARMGKAGRERVLRLFTREAVLSDLVTLYRERGVETQPLRRTA